MSGMLFPQIFGPGKRDKETWQLNGDQVVLSSDTSLFRSGSSSFIPVGSPVYVLLGNQIGMFHLCHNTGIDESGKFLPRDDPGGCSLTVWCEDDTLRFYGAPAGVKGSFPVFTLYTTLNLLTGVWTYVSGITPSQTAGIVGTTAANNANAGAVGEYVTATVATGSAVTLTTAIVSNVTSISLTAGDWDVDGVVDYNAGATTSITQLQQGTSSTTAALGAQDTYTSEAFAAMVPGALPLGYWAPTTRISLASTTTIYLVAKASFTVSTLAAYGTIRARRVR